MTNPPFPGAVAVTHLLVYDTQAPDGLRGGTPHVHSACTEAYAVAAGTGVVQTMSAAGYEETPIEAGSFVWFTPGTIHRLVNTSGELEIFVIMANAGLPEAGDMVLTFPSEVLADPSAYAEAVALPEDGARRDLAVEGFATIKAGGAPALAFFHRQAAALLAPRAADWQQVWEDGPRAETERVAAQIAAIASGDPWTMADASVHSLPPADRRSMGCCGTLGKYLP